MADKCTAKRKSDGSRCTRWAIEGGSVCMVHGGAAPQVRKAAEARLAALVCPAIGVLRKTLKDRQSRPDLALSAARDILDRNGHKAKDKLELSNAPGESFNLSVLTDDQLNSLSSILATARVSGGAEETVPEQD